MDDALPLLLDTKATRQRALYEALRRAILGGRLARGGRLPPSRDLAVQYGLARGTVTAVYEQLAAEGYLQARVGSGTYVSDRLPEDLQPAAPVIPPRGGRRVPVPGGTPDSPFPVRGVPPDARPFQAHLPSLEDFPFERWAQLSARAERAAGRAMLGDADSAGYLPLRTVLAEHLGRTRGVRCQVEQVVIVSGTQQALDLTLRLLLSPGEEVAIEDPGYPGAAALFRLHRLMICAVPVDEEGLRVDELGQRAAHPRLVHVTPAHQAPTGVPLSIGRRLALLRVMAANGGWIFEDDYDSQYRYEGRPIPALQGLDEHGVVIHAGSFSKTLFPALRVGYVVLPEALVAPFLALRSVLDRFTPPAPQIALHRFFVEGDYERHLRRMRARYTERRAALLESLAALPGPPLCVSPHDAGLDALLWLPDGTDEIALVDAARQRGLWLEPVSRYRLEAGCPARPGVLLGFAAFTPARIRHAVTMLGDLLRPGPTA